MNTVITSKPVTVAKPAVGSSSSSSESSSGDKKDLKVTLIFFRQQVFFVYMKQKIYSIDIYTDNYLPPFFNDRFRLLLNCFLLLECGHITDING